MKNFCLLFYLIILTFSNNVISLNLKNYFSFKTVNIYKSGIIDHRKSFHLESKLSSEPTNKQPTNILKKAINILGLLSPIYFISLISPSAHAFSKDLLLGGTSGVIAKTLCAPLERVKIILQTQAANTQLKGSDKYVSIGDAFNRLIKDQGLISLWRGNTANCLRYFPTQAMNFAFKEKYQNLFLRPRSEVGFLLYFLGYLASGAAAGATSLTLSYPLEYTYTRMAADIGSGGNKKYNDLFDCIKKTVKANGVKGLYQGYGPSVAGIIVYRAGYFGLYDFFKTTIYPNLEISGYKLILAKFSIALLIDIFSAMLAYPLDTIRRSLMMQSDSKEVLFTDSISCAKYIVKKDGWKGLYKGCLMNNIRAIGSAMVLVLYDEFKKILL
jgi:solute carrier family 25 (adenine nucleotide translocator) protein 4/5/6/31